MKRRKRSRKESGSFNVWRSYSDMMAGVVLLFVLIMCVTLFQAQKNYSDKLAEQEERLRLQDEYAAEMAIKQDELAEQDALLAQQRDKLEEQNLTLDELQAALDEQAKILASKQATLEEQESVLAEQRSTMKSQQSELDKLAAQLEQQQQQLKTQANEIASKTRQLKEKQAQIDRIIGVKADVIEALQKEFQSNNVNVAIDAQTGAMMLDAKVMFDYDSAELTDEGRAVLRQVLPIYCKVLLSNQYKDNVAEIMIDGYTDTDGSYEYNLELSQMRALAVSQYLLEIEGEFLNSTDSATLREILTVSGHSWSNPILDAAGNIDKEASRRVEVKFRLKDEEMIEELRSLTE